MFFTFDSRSSTRPSSPGAGFPAGASPSAANAPRSRRTCPRVCSRCSVTASFSSSSWICRVSDGRTRRARTSSAVSSVPSRSRSRSRALSMWGGISTRCLPSSLSFSLRDHGVARVARRLETGLEDRPAEGELAGEDESATCQRYRPAAAGAEREQGGPDGRARLGDPPVPSGLVLLVHLADEAEALLHRLH